MRVLLVEDDPRIARDVAAALAAGGYVVEQERDGEEAWFKGDTEEYDAVVLDLGLPGMDGLSVLKRWRANGRRFRQTAQVGGGRLSPARTRSGSESPTSALARLQNHLRRAAAQIFDNT